MSLQWDEKKQRYIRKKEEKLVDDEKGLVEPRELSDSLLRLYIRNSYARVNEFDINILKKELPIPHQDRDIKVEAYFKFLEDYLERIKMGRLPDKSYIIVAPPTFGKKTFAFQVIKECLARGFEPTEILDANQLFKEDREDETSNLIYQKLQEKDLVIVTFGGAPSGQGLIMVKKILEYCGREGKPVLILSRLHVEFYHGIDNYTTFYLGVRNVRKGEFGKAELRGFTIQDLGRIRELTGVKNDMKWRGK